MKKTQMILITALLIIVIFPISAQAANSSDAAGNVILDQPIVAGTLQSHIEALPDISGPTDITTLTITSTGELNNTDIAYINLMSNMVTLNVANVDDVVNVGDDFLRDNNSIQNVIFPAQTFGNNTFRNCDNISSVTLSAAVPAEFGNDAFDGCDTTTGITVYNAKTFGDNAFDDCDNLITANLPDATAFGERAFDDCVNISSVTLSASNPADFGDYAFTWCNATTGITVNHARSFGRYAFRACHRIETANLPDATTFGDRAFDDCNNLSSVTLSDANHATFGNYAFYNCDTTTSITVYNAQSFGENAFDGDSLVDIYLPDATTFGYRAFYNIDNLSTVILSATNPATFGAYAFGSCDATANITVYNARSFGDNAFYSCDILTTVNLPHTTAFGANTFNYSETITDLTLGNVVPTVGAFASGIPSSGARVHVPYAAVSLYDPDGDGMWEGWIIDPLPADAVMGKVRIENPKTGDDTTQSKPSWMFVTVLFAVGYLLIWKSSKRSKHQYH